MAVNTITEPSADEKQKLVYNRKMRRSNTVEIDPSQKLTVCLLKLAPAVTQSDYPTLKTAIEAVAGIQSISLLVDGQAPASIPADTDLRIVVDAQMRIDNTPEEP